MTSNMWPDTRQGKSIDEDALLNRVLISVFFFLSGGNFVRRCRMISERNPVSRSGRKSLLVERKPRVSTGTSAISIENNVVDLRHHMT